MKEYKWVSQLCDEINISLMKNLDPGLSPGSSAAIALYISGEIEKEENMISRRKAQFITAK